MKFFVSFSHRDTDNPDLPTHQLPTRLKDALGKPQRPEDDRHEVFVDEVMLGGVEWRPELRDQIADADYFLILDSANSKASPDVAKELELALTLSKSFWRNWRKLIGKKPIIYPILVDGSLRNPDLERFQCERWQGDFGALLDRIRKRLSHDAARVARLRRFAVVAMLLLLAILAYIFVFEPLANIRKLRSAESLSRAKEYRQRTGYRVWSARADAAYAQFLGRWSAAHLANATKSIEQGKVPEGLVLAALVAQENGGNLDGSFRKAYDDGNYASLKQTLRTGSTLGAGLAVSSDGTQIAAGNALWNLTSSGRCSLGLDAINDVAFGPRGLYTGGNENVLTWTSCRPGTQVPVREEVQDLEDRVQYVAVARDGVVAFVMRKGSSVLLHKGGTAFQPLSHAEPVRSVSFSDDGSFLITTSGETLNVWNRTVWSRPHAAPRKINTGLSLLGASLNGDYVAVAGPQMVKVWRLRPAPQFQYEIPSNTPLRAVALSEEPNLLAIVTDEGVLAERVSKGEFRLGAKQSVASDVVFSDVEGQLIVKRIDAVEIWNPGPSSSDVDPPRDRLDRWTKKFALTVDEDGHFAPVLFREDR